VQRRPPRSQTVARLARIDPHLPFGEAVQYESAGELIVIGHDPDW